MKVNTLLLKTMLGNINKCKSNNLLEITKYYLVQAKSQVLTISATDGNNQIYCTMNIETDEEFYAIVNADQFNKLISKTTTDDVTLKIKESHLNVIGNGNYKIEIVEDEDYPSNTVKQVGQTFTINSNDLKYGINSCNKAKSLTVSDGVLFGYLIREGNMIAADAIKVCCTAIDMSDEDIQLLIQPTLADLLQTLDKEKVEVEISDDGNSVMFIGESVSVYGALMEGVEEYPDVTPLLDDDYPCVAEFDTTEFIRTIDRLSLFVGTYDKDIISVIFNEDGVVLTTNTGSMELIEYTSIDGYSSDYTLEFDINNKYLRDLVSSIKSATFKLNFGQEDTFKLESEDTIMLLAIADED